jgi:hypothetical protein
VSIVGLKKAAGESGFWVLLPVSLRQRRARQRCLIAAKL